MQDACKIDPQYILNFGEEIIRGQPLFVLSILLQNLEPMLRKTAELADWQVAHLMSTRLVCKEISWKDSGNTVRSLQAESCSLSIWGQTCWLLRCLLFGNLLRPWSDKALVCIDQFNEFEQPRANKLQFHLSSRYASEKCAFQKLMQ